MNGTSSSRPTELRAALGQAGLNVSHETGVTYNPLGGAWSLSRDMAVNYMLLAARA